MGSRRKSRELAMQMLFQGDLGKQKPEDVERLFWDSRDDVDDETRGFADDLHRLATKREDEVDALISKHAQNWRLERMPVVDRNLLRVAVAEMLGYPKTPAAVVINEALEIARRYAAPESVHFLNGVLDAVGRELLEQRLATGSLRGE
jgi:N utilization substance protein B